jgi:microcystin-dependent protein
MKSNTRHHVLRVTALSFALGGLLGAPGAHAQADPLIGQLMLFAGTFCPNGWAQADGTYLPIAQNSALFSILGTTYGGDGMSNFRLPDLRGRTPIGDGQQPGLSNFSLGQWGGQESVTLTQAQMPSHVHMQNITATTAPATDSAPGGGRMLAQSQNAGIYAVSNGSTTSVAAGATGSSGGSQPVAIRDPYLTMRWCVATQGTYPSRQ